MDKKLFGTRINKARKDRGLTAEKLAEACNINSTYLRQIEGGKKLPSLPVFATLCRELRVSPNYILPDLVEGTEAEKIQKIFSESDPTPSQIEMLAEMAGVILKERYPSHEWNDGVKDRIYCLGRIDQMTDELLPECKACPDHVNKAQGDLEAFYGRDRNGG